MNRIAGKSARTHHATVHEAAESLLLKTVDASLFAIIFIAPCLMGGRHPLGRLAYLGFVSVAAIAWVARQTLRANATYRKSGTELLWLLAGAVVVLQLVSLPESVLQWVAPELTNLLPLWSSTSDGWRLGSWSQISLTPDATRSGLVMLLTHATLLAVVLQRLDGLVQIQRFLRWIAVAGVAVAVLGLAQYLVGNGAFLWIYRDPTRDTHPIVRGPFFNENHFAHFLAIALAPTIVWFHGCVEKRSGSRGNPWDSSKDQRSRFVVFLLGLGMAIIVFAALLTRSRGGILVLLLSAAVTIGRLAWEGRMRRQTLMALGGMAFSLVLALAIHGHVEVRREVASLASGSLEELDQHAIRRTLWQSAISVVQQFPLFGTGVGSYRDVYPLHFATARHLDYSYAESGYLQVLAETGLTGGLLMCVALWSATRWVVPRRRSAIDPNLSSISAVTLATIAVSMVHSIFDFVWYLPACLSITLIIAAGACRAYQLTAPDVHQRSHFAVPRPIWGIALAASVWLAFLSIGQLKPAAIASRYWDAYVAESNLARRGDPMELRSEPASLPDWQDSRDAALRMRRHLRNTLAIDPRNARAHLRLATVCMRLFELDQQKSENAMSLAQIRDAALASEFPTLQAQDQWLSVALGENRQPLDEALFHALQAVKISPMQGEAYVHLAELAFLKSPRPSPYKQLVHQAVCVRPHAATVQFAAGREAALERRYQDALRLWQMAYRREVGIRHAIIQMMAPELKAEFFIEQFQPDLPGLHQLYEFYSRMLMESHAAFAAGTYFARIQSDDHADAREWQTAYTMAAQLNQSERAIQCARRAVALDAGNYQMRRRLAFELLSHGEFHDAIEHLHWCTRRRPGDRAAHEKLDWARQQVEPD